MEKGSRPKADCSRVINEGNEDSNKEVEDSTSSSSSSRVSSNVPTKRKRAMLLLKLGYCMTMVMRRYVIGQIYIYCCSG